MRAVGQHVSGKRDILSPEIPELTTPLRRVALFATLALGFFFLGFAPMWLKATRSIEQRDAAQRGMRLAQLQNTLAAALIEVQRGQYEPARQLTSDFYTDLRRQVDSDDPALLTAKQRDGFRSLLAERDELITLIARSDTASQNRLFAVYSTYNKLANSGR